MMKFFVARIVSLGVEEGGLLLFVSMLGWNNMAVKAGLAVIVIILNYICSKFFVFNSENKTTETDKGKKTTDSVIDIK